ncbi:MAG: hypothetical protein QME74_02750 [Candidatus Edwardsbacteria bacterium]|nr:hypothetical protein [Candidatus Edwardsbacteria bacterium]
MKQLVLHISVIFVFIGMTQLACSLFDDGPPRVTFIRPKSGDTLSTPVIVEVRDERKLMTYGSATVRDSFLIASGSHTMEALAYDDGQREGRAAVIFIVR